MNIRNTAFLTLALLVIAAPAFASQTVKPQGGKPTGEKPGITAQALELGKSGLKKVTDHPYVTSAVAVSAVAGTAAVVAYKKSPKFKAKVDETAAAAKARVETSYKAICAKLSALSNKQFTKSDALIGAGLVAVGGGLYKYSDSIKSGLVSAKDGVTAKASAAYTYCATSKVGLAVKNASTTAKVTAAAATALVGVAAYKAYNYFKNRKKAATPVATTPAVPATVVTAPAASAQ